MELCGTDPVSNWSSLHPVVRAGLTVRVCCVGAESTGKSTLVNALAERFNTSSMHEFGRDYTIFKKEQGTNDHWTTRDFVVIAQEQQRLEDLAAHRAGPVMFCDTDAMTTDLWHERYLGSRDPDVDRISRNRRYDLFVLCGTDIPWVADEIRLGEDTREKMQRRFEEVLQNERVEPYVLAEGTVQERVDTVADAIDALRLLTTASLYRAERWQPLC